MHSKTYSNHAVILRDLGDDLILRRSIPEDGERLGNFNKMIHGEDEEDGNGVADWTRDLLTGKHPNFSSDDYTIVENTRTGEIVSSLNLISQVWSFDGIRIGVGRPELVGTLPEYRNRGLVRLQFDEVHRWSRERGEVLQAITGIPYYYRQFGYEMCVNLGGGWAGSERGLPKLPDGEKEPFVLRKAGLQDIADILRLYDRGNSRYLLSTVWTEDLLRHEMLDKSPGNINRRTPVMIESAGGRCAGFLALPPRLWNQHSAATAYEIDPSFSWQQVTPSAARGLLGIGKEMAAAAQSECAGVQFHLGVEHPAYTVATSYLPVERPAYGWFIRVEDIPAFIRMAAPVFEKRLAASPCSGYSGELLVSFYRSGLKLVFENGKISAAESYRPLHEVQDSAAFPGLTFLHLLFGYRTLEELHHIFPDCWANAEARIMIDCLFPKINSNLWPLA